MINNKNGNLTNLIGGLFFIFLITFVIVLLIPIQDRTTTKEEVINTLDWNSTKFIPNESTSRLSNMMLKITDALGYTIFESAKFGVEWGADNLQFNARLLAYLLLIGIILTLSVPLIKILLVLIIFIKETIQARRERVEKLLLRYKRYKEAKDKK